MITIPAWLFYPMCFFAGVGIGRLILDPLIDCWFRSRH